MDGRRYVHDFFLTTWVLVCLVAISRFAVRRRGGVLCAGGLRGPLGRFYCLQFCGSPLLGRHGRVRRLYGHTRRPGPGGRSERSGLEQEKIFFDLSLGLVPCSFVAFFFFLRFWCLAYFESLSLVWALQRALSWCSSLSRQTQRTFFFL